MATSALEILGTLRPDGTLVLDEKPNLPPGRVRVTLQAVPDDKPTEIGQFFERLHADMAAKGHRFRTAEEIDADLAQRQRDEEEYDQYMDRVRAEGGRARRDPEPQGGA
jgi:hypothetical protein